MVDINQIYPSKYLKSADIGDTELHVTVSTTAPTSMDDGTMKLAVEFQEPNIQPLLCNKTNANRIAALYGPDTDNWIGRKLVLHTEWVDFQGKPTKAIRVKMAGPGMQPDAQAPAQTPNTGTWPPEDQSENPAAGM